MPVGVNRTWVKYIEHGEFPESQRAFSVMRCNHCDNAPCVEICPVTALYTREDGIVDFDDDRCIGCKACTQACPYDALYMDPVKNTAAKCNYCSHRTDVGLEPACVVVCPEEAIIAGDMSNPISEISQLLKSQTVTARKPEAGTIPKLFYIEGDQASLVPTQTDRKDYLWSSQDKGVGHNMSKSVDKFESFGKKAERTYDAPDKGIMWGWEVPTYLVTKGIAGGMILIVFILALMGENMGRLLFPSSTIALIMVGLTGALLVKDLDRPDRFLNVLFRPQWKSWLVKGAYIFSIFGALLTLWVLGAWFEWALLTRIVTYAALPFALLTVIYTAFLFRQAKGREYWQNPLLSLHMLVHSIVLGGAVLLIVGRIVVGSCGCMALIPEILKYALIANLGLIILELAIKPKSADAQRAHHIIQKGRLRLHFWLGGVLLACVLPLGMLFMYYINMEADYLAASLVIVGTWFSNHVMVKAPQLIPLS